jgi:hypothetical protein
VPTAVAHLTASSGEDISISTLTGPDGFGYRRTKAGKTSPPELVQRFEEVVPALPGVSVGRCLATRCRPGTPAYSPAGTRIAWCCDSARSPC